MKSFYNFLFWIGIVLWILENTYFGWHATSQSGAESVCDLIVSVLMMLGVIGSISIGAVERYLEHRGL